MLKRTFQLISIINILMTITAYAGDHKPDYYPRYMTIHGWSPLEFGDDFFGPSDESLFQNSPTLKVEADVMLGGTVVKKRTFKMFKIDSNADFVFPPELRVPVWENSCLTPIEVDRKRKGKTTIKFHTRTGKPGKEIVLPKENDSHRIGICMPKTKRTVLVSEYDYYDDMLTKSMGITYYDACGDIQFTRYSSFTYTNTVYNQQPNVTTEGCIGINDEGTILLETMDENFIATRNNITPNLERAGIPVYIRYDGVAMYGISKSELTVGQDTEYAFSAGSKYACFFDEGKYRSSHWPSMRFISCLNLPKSSYLYVEVDGIVKNIRVTDTGDVTADYSDDPTTDMEPGKKYILHFSLNDVKEEKNS